MDNGKQDWESRSSKRMRDERKRILREKKENGGRGRREKLKE